MCAVDATASTARVLAENGALHGIRPVPTSCKSVKHFHVFPLCSAAKCEEPMHGLRASREYGRERLTFSNSDGKTPPSRQ
jgi:hypothetical protein